MTTYVLDLDCYLDPKARRSLSPNGRAHWRTKAKAAGEVRGEARFLMGDALVKHQAWKRNMNRSFCGITLNIDAGFRGAGSADVDNIWGMFKPARDGIADALWPERSSSRRDADVTLGECRLVEERRNPWFRVEVVTDGSK